MLYLNLVDKILVYGLLTCPFIRVKIFDVSMKILPVRGSTHQSPVNGLWNFEILVYASTMKLNFKCASCSIVANTLQIA